MPEIVNDGTFFRQPMGVLARSLVEGCFQAFFTLFLFWNLPS